jgi:hypothetical protein
MLHVKFVKPPFSKVPPPLQTNYKLVPVIHVKPVTPPCSKVTERHVETLAVNRVIRVKNLVSFYEGLARFAAGQLKIRNWTRGN